MKVARSNVAAAETLSLAAAKRRTLVQRLLEKKKVLRVHEIIKKLKFTLFLN